MNTATSQQKVSLTADRQFIPDLQRSESSCRGRINYFDFLASLENEDCCDALKRITPKIDLQKINELIDKTPYTTDLQKEFYKTMIAERKEKILDKALELLHKKEGK